MSASQSGWQILRPENIFVPALELLIPKYLNFLT
jgi:hypothetical protein